MDQLADVWSNDISLMRPRPKFGKRKIIANNWLAEKKENILIRSNVDAIFLKFTNWRSHLFYSACLQIFQLNKHKSSKLRQYLLVTLTKCTKPMDQVTSGPISYKLPHVWQVTQDKSYVTSRTENSLHFTVSDSLPADDNG